MLPITWATTWYHDTAAERRQRFTNGQERPLNREEMHLLATQHPVQQLQDNRVALEQILQCPRVAQSKPTLQAILESMVRAGDHRFQATLIHSSAQAGLRAVSGHTIHTVMRVIVHFAYDMIPSRYLHLMHMCQTQGPGSKCGPPSGFVWPAGA